MTASGLPWRAREADARTALAIAQQQGISEILAQVLAGRGVTPEQAAAYLTPTLRADLPDPFHLLGMRAAIARLDRAIQAGEKIAVFGDYDVDGATSTALLQRYFAALGIGLIPYIPDRQREGYGPSEAAFSQLIDRGVTLILTVDCGTLAHAPIALAKARGADVIVIDHHLSDGALPDACAIINPNRVDETSPHRNLAAVGVTFLLIAALHSHLNQRAAAPAFNLLHLLDLVALGTVCDVMPLTGLNRTLVTQGLKMLAQRRNAGLAALMDVARLDEPPGVYTCGFLLGPRINAGGRVGESALGAQLLSSDDAAVNRDLAQRLDGYNAERQAIEASVLEAARAMAKRQDNLPVILLAATGWHEGVIGIVAGRIKEEYQRPALVVSLKDGIGKGSGRSVPGADLGAAIHGALAAGHLTKGGGHAMAAGFSLEESRLPALHDYLIARLESAVNAYQDRRERRYDAALSVAGATPALIEELARGGPYGLGNPAPRLVIPQARIFQPTVMKERHLRVLIGDDSGTARLTGVAFGAMESPLGPWLLREKTLHLLGELRANFWQGQQRVQFQIEDAALPAA